VIFRGSCRRSITAAPGTSREWPCVSSSSAMGAKRDTTANRIKADETTTLDQMVGPATVFQSWLSGKKRRRKDRSGSGGSGTSFHSQRAMSPTVHPTSSASSRADQFMCKRNRRTSRPVSWPGRSAISLTTTSRQSISIDFWSYAILQLYPKLGPLAVLIRNRLRRAARTATGFGRKAQTRVRVSESAADLRGSFAD